MPHPSNKTEALGSSVIVLGSRSPRRLELLSRLIDRVGISVVPPIDPTEAGFDGITKPNEIESRLLSIAEEKARQVASQLPGFTGAVLTADTVVVCRDCDNQGWVVLGQPPEPEWREVVREWFRRYYLGRTHAVWTAIVVRQGERQAIRCVKSEVTMLPEDPELLEWYLTTGEPLGKAGGYGIQGAADVFVQKVEGSLSNVIGLPLRETRAALRELGVLK